MSKQIKQLVSHVRRNAGDINVVLGPMCWLPGQDGGKEWYFTIASCDKGKQFRLDKIVTGGDRDEGEEMRACVQMAFVRHRPLVIHDTDDELYMARLCETIWPGERISKMRADIEAERAEAA